MIVMAHICRMQRALSYADHTIRELRNKSGYEDDLTLMMIVSDQAGQTVLSLPFFPGLFARIAANIAKIPELLGARPDSGTLQE